MTIPSAGYDSATITNPSAALTDFSLLVDLSTMSVDWWADVNTSDGTRGRVSTSGGTELAVDWIDFDDSAETGFARVLWTGTLASSGTQILRIYSPNTRSAAVAAADTYGSDNAYKTTLEAYYPLDGGSSADRTVNSLDLTDFNTPTTGVASQVGEGFNFNGSNQYSEIAASPVSALPITLSGWFKNDIGSSGSRCLFFYGDSSSSASWFSLEYNGSDIQSYGRGTYAPTYTSSGTDYADGNWHHIVGICFYTDRGNVSLYIDGSYVGGGAFSGSDIAIENFDTVSIARRGDLSPGQYFDGTEDDLQIHSEILSAEWIAEEYAQGDNQSTFWGTWAWTAVGGVLAGTVAESLLMSGSATKKAIFSATSIESFGVADVGGNLATLVGTISDALNLTSATVNVKNTSGAVTESLIFTDAVTVSAILAGILSETINLATSTTPTAKLTTNILEALNISDSSSLGAAIVAAVLEALNLTSVVSALATLRSSSIEALDISEVNSARLLLTASSAESITLSESILNGLISSGVVIESLSISSAAAVGAIISAALADSIALTGSSSVNAVFNVTVSENVGLLETLMAVARLQAAIAENLNLTDVVVESATLPNGLITISFTTRGHSITFNVNSPSINITSN